MISYEELSLVFDMENPLTLGYFELVDKSTNEETYCENHHILPKSIWPEYDRRVWNKVRLTYKDHFRVHEILPFICLQKKHKEQMICAWSRMSTMKNGVVVTQNDYEVLRKMHSDHKREWMSENSPTKGVGHSDETRKKIAEKAKGRVPSEETKRKISIANSGENNPNFGNAISEDRRLKQSKTMKGRKLSEEHKHKIHLATKGENNPNFGRVFGEDVRKRMSEAHKGDKHFMYGKKHSEETKRKMAIAATGRVPSDETRIKISQVKKAQHAAKLKVLEGDLTTEEISDTNVYL